MEEAIYSLVDPRDNLEFYVGRTQDIYLRFIQHLKCQDKNDAKNARIRELQALHLLPIMRTLELVKDSALAGEREAYWIRHFRHLGITLTNDILFSGPRSLERKQELEIKRREEMAAINKQGRGSSDAAKRIRRILRRNSNIGVCDLAKKANVSKGYASKMRSQFLKDSQIEEVN